MKLNHRLLATLAVIVMTNCDMEQTSSVDEEEARIERLFPDWVSRFMETRDPKDYFEGVSDNYVVMGCGFDPITSRDTLEAEIRGLAKSDVTIRIEDCQSYEIIIRDDIAIHRYACFEAVTSKTDTTGRRVAFNFLDILKKSDDNEWKIHLHLATEAIGTK